MVENTGKAIWYLFTTMLSIFGVCTIQIFDGFNGPFYIVAFNALLSLAALIFQMHVDGQSQKRPLMVLIRIMLFLNSVSVFITMGLSYFMLTTQYHNSLTADRKVSSVEELQAVLEEAGEGVSVVETDKYYIYYADYDRLTFVTDERPSQRDDSNLMSLAAAFQYQYEMDFHHENIIGCHVSEGQLDPGFPLEGLGAFTFVDGTAKIWDVDKAEQALEDAATRGGSGFQQFIVLYDGQPGTHKTEEFRCYRTLAILNEKACVIDSRTQMHYDDFIRGLQELGVRDALYCDMGSGWNYSWYRRADGKVIDIIGQPWPFSHNWLVFQK